MLNVYNKLPRNTKIVYCVCTRVFPLNVPHIPPQMPAPVISDSVAERWHTSNYSTLLSFIPNFTRERKHAFNCETHWDKNNKRARVLRWHHHFCFVSSVRDVARPVGVDWLTFKTEEENLDCKFSLRGQNKTVICLKCVQLLGRFSHSMSCHTHTHAHTQEHV